MIIGSFVPIPGGTGGLEYAFVHYFGFFIVSAPLVAAMLVWRFMTYYLMMSVGGVMLLFKKREN